MLAAAFFVTVVVALGGYHFFIERPRRATLQRLDRQAFAGPVPLEEVVGALPGGVFLQNGFTWSRVVPDGAVEVGVNPMLIGLLGGGADFTLDEPGVHVDRGSPLLEIGRDGRSIVLPRDLRRNRPTRSYSCSPRSQASIRVRAAASSRISNSCTTLCSFRSWATRAVSASLPCCSSSGNIENSSILWCIVSTWHWWPQIVPAASRLRRCVSSCC